MKKKTISKLTTMKAGIFWPTILLGVLVVVSSLFIGSIISWKVGTFFIVLEIVVTFVHIFTWENDKKLLKIDLYPFYYSFFQ